MNTFEPEKIQPFYVGQHKKYKVSEKIGSGSFGEIYIGVDESFGRHVAIKLEKTSNRYPQLIHEGRIYQALQGEIGIPSLYYVGTDYELGYHMLVTDLLGPNLEDLLNFCNRHFSLKTVLVLGDQMLTRIQYLHSKGYIHRDIKPENFLMGSGPLKHQVYMIDFGLSKKYLNSRNNHLPYREGRPLTGTARYASTNAHHGIELSRRDDLESLGYCLIYFLKGEIPWQGIKAGNKKQKHERIGDCKLSTSVKDLCLHLPTEFGIYLNYCKDLKYEATPDYDYLRKLFHVVFQSFLFVNNYVYDWTVIKNESIPFPCKEIPISHSLLHHIIT